MASGHLTAPAGSPSLTSSPLRPSRLWHPHHSACPPLGHGQGTVGPGPRCAQAPRDSLGLWVPWGRPGKLWAGRAWRGPRRDAEGRWQDSRWILCSRRPQGLSAALRLCVSDWGCSRPHPWAALGPGHPLIHSLAHLLEPVTLEGTGGGENLALGPPPSPFFLLSHPAPRGHPASGPAAPWSLVNHTPLTSSP